MIFSINMVSAIEVEESDNSTTYQLSSIDSSSEIAAGDTDSSLESPTSGTVYVSKTGSDSNDGSTKDKALASLTHALNVVPNSGNIIMLDGAYSYSSISIPSSKIVTIEGEGNVNLTGLSAYSTFIINFPSISAFFIFFFHLNFFQPFHILKHHLRNFVSVLHLLHPLFQL